MKSYLCKRLFRTKSPVAIFLILTSFLFVSWPMFAQDVISVKGIVEDVQGEPIIGATIILKGTSQGTITDINGRYSIKAELGQSLVFSYLGYNEQTIAIAGRTEINVIMEEQAQELDDVVVVGYGVQKKINLTGAVATIDASSFETRPIVSASTALQGAVSGVTVTTQSGSPGGDSGDIRIRGINSFGGSSTSPLVLVDGIESSMNNIDPGLIESISVLKDAASASIYGSRAANGVILITTKRGSKDRFSASYKGYVGWQSPTDLPKLVNGLEYKELTMAMNAQDGIVPTDEELESLELYRKNMGKDVDLYPNTDWQDAVLQGSGLIQNHNVSLGLGSEAINMLTTFGYTDQQGIIKNAGYKRYSFRNNADIKFDKKLTMKMDLSFSNGDRVASPYQSTIFNYMNTRPADIANKFSSGLYNGQGLQGNNPEALMLYGGNNKTNTLNFSGAATLIFKPAEWISVQGMLAPRYTTTNRHNWKRKVITQQHYKDAGTLTSIPLSTLTESGSRSFYGNYNFMTTIDKTIGDHNLGAILGVERNTMDYKYLMAYRQGFNYEDYDQIDAGEIVDMDNGGRQYQWAIQSYFGRLNYNYKQRYLFEGNLRMDGSSRFTNENRWGYFPSVSGAWRISEEEFMKNAKDAIDGLKVRVSFGTLGNQNLAGGDAASYYPTTQNLATGQISMNDVIYPLVTLNTLANSDIKWETTTMFDAGVDMTLFKNINITADWYRKTTDDILMKLDIPLGVGLNAPYQNAGKVRNTGWEVSAGYNKKWNDFTFGVRANLSDVKNEIIDMRGKTSTSGVLRNQEGSSIASIYALKSMGIIRTQEEADWVNLNCPQFQTSNQGQVNIGDIRYADINGDDQIDENDKTIVGSTIPRYTYSLDLNLGWKNFRLGILLQGVGKADGYLGSYYVMPSTQGGTFRKEHLDYAWDKNPNGKTPRLSNIMKNNWENSSFWMRDASYLRVKNIQLGYDLPKLWLQKLGLNGVYVYANAQNLFTFSNFWNGYDPEVGYGGDASGDFDVVSLGSANNYPQVKIISMGIDIKF